MLNALCKRPSVQGLIPKVCWWEVGPNGRSVVIGGIPQRGTVGLHLVLFFCFLAMTHVLLPTYCLLHAHPEAPNNGFT
jgi:hypothetical protein